MENLIPQSLALALFYSIGLAQVVLISLYIPNLLARRMRFVFTTYPADQYPKLYPYEMGHISTERRLKGLSLFTGLNAVIALIGIALLGSLFVSGYRLADKGGDEIFVIAYFFLQAVPLLYAGVKESKHLALLRKAYDDSIRHADLQPRRLFDFVSPWTLLLAVGFYIGWLITYLGSRELDTQPASEIYATVGGITGMNLIYAYTIRRVLQGIGQNPYMAAPDKRTMALTMCKMLPVLSIIASAFLIFTQLADTYALEIIDPVMTSLYLQLCAIIGFGMTTASMKVESIDFEPYREVTS